MTNVQEKRREYVYKKFGMMTQGTNISNKSKTKLLKKLWREAKKKYK